MVKAPFLLTPYGMNEQFNGKVRLVVERQHEKGWGSKRTAMVSERNYDIEGHLVEERFRRRRHINRITYKYNRNGHCIERREYDAERMQFFRYKYKYDRWGNQIEEQAFAPDGTLSAIFSSKYTSEGRETEKRRRKGESAEQIIYKHDDQGNVIEEEKQVNGKFEMRRLYQYDSHGNKTEESFFTQEGEMGSQHIDYQYDPEGRIVEQRITSTPSGERLRYTFEYDAAGRVTRRCLYDGMGHFNGTTILFTDQGAKQQERWFNSETHVCGRTEYLYDEQGHLIEENIYQGLFEAQEQTVSVETGAVVQSIIYKPSNEQLRFQYRYRFDKEGNHQASTETQYDDEGNTIQYRHRTLTPEGQIYKETIDNQTTKYTYDSLGNWIVRETYHNKTLAETIVREITYWEEES